MKRFKRQLKDFIKKEPIYISLAIFVILINLMTLIPTLKKEDLPEKVPSKAKELIQKRAELGSAIMKDERTSMAASVIGTGIALVIFVGLMLDFAILIRKMDKRELLPRSHSPPMVSWSIWDALKVIILFLFFGYLILIMEALMAPIFPFIRTRQRMVSIANTTILDLIGVSMIFYFAILRYRHNIKDLGLSLKNLLKNIFYGVFGYISLTPVLLAALLMTIIFVNLFRYEPTPQPILELFLEEEKLPILIYLSIFVSIAGPVVEEIFFRSFLYNAIKKESNVKWAILISAILFSFLHGHVVGFLPILILGIFLAYLYEKTGSLIPSITVHIIHNLIMLSFVFLIKGIGF